jgi:hypothetical protein
MPLSRRQFLTTLAGAALFTPLVGRAALSASQQLRYLSARADSEGHYFLSGFDAAGKLRFDLPLPGRGHAIATHPTLPHAVQVARRPGHYLLVVDVASGKVLHEVHSAGGRHFYGHGVFSADGRWFYTPENDYENARGMIGVRDVHDNYRQIAEFSSHGVGPHDLRLLADGTTLVVANGGMQTHPDTGRATLNLETMSPSLAYLDRRDGRLLEEHRLPQTLHKNSIRHLGSTSADTVCFVMQYQGSRREHPPLIGLHRRGETIRLLSAPETIQARMRNYCGSACADPSGKWFAVSSPKGGLVTFWDANSGAYCGHTDVADGCGIAAGNEPGEFLLSSGLGGVWRYRLSGQQQPLGGLAAMDARWDNHMARLQW